MSLHTARTHTQIYDVEAGAQRRGRAEARGWEIKRHDTRWMTHNYYILRSGPKLLGVTTDVLFCSVLLLYLQVSDALAEAAEAFHVAPNHS